MTTFTLPTDGRSFTVPVQISFFATGMNYGTGETVNVGGGASGHISFYSSNGLYYANNFVQAPEPGTLGFVGTGLIGILASVRKRLRM